MANLKLVKSKKLREVIENCERSVVEVGAPELGDGCFVYARVLTIDEIALVHGIQKDTNLTTADRYKQLLAMCTAEPDGSPAFTGPDDPTIGKMFLRLADRIIEVATSR